MPSANGIYQQHSTATFVCADGEVGTPDAGVAGLQQVAWPEGGIKINAHFITFYRSLVLWRR
jgi:hypothetical protein